MKKINNTFKKDKFNFVMQSRIGMLCIFSKQSKTGRITYEVVRLKALEAEEYTCMGRHVILGDREVYPRSEEWGIRGWTYIDIATAQAKYSELYVQDKQGGSSK